MADLPRWSGAWAVRVEEARRVSPEEGAGESAGSLKNC